MKAIRIALPCLFALALPAAAPAAPVTGGFVIDGKPVAASEIAAFRVRDQFNPRQYETYVTLTATPMDKAAIAADFDPYAKAINDPAVMQADYIAFSVGPDGVVGMNAHVGGVQYVDSSGVIMGERGSLTASCRENSATHVACTVRTAKPVKSIAKREDVFPSGRFAEQAPDIMMVPNEGYSLTHAKSALEDADWVSGDHRMEGVIVAVGPNVEPFERTPALIDMAPTLVAALDAPTAVKPTGRVLTEIIGGEGALTEREVMTGVRWATPAICR